MSHITKSPEVPPEMVEGVINLDDRTATAVANAKHLAGAVRDVVQAICRREGQNDKTNPTHHHDTQTINVNGTSVTLQQEKILPTGIF